MSRSNILHKALIPTLLCLLALVVVACGGEPEVSQSQNKAPAPADKQVLRYPIGSTDFGSLDPALATANIDGFAMQTFYTGLVTYKEDHTVVDQMAASHSISADGLTYTFMLKPDLKFSDGTPLTANDVAYSLNRVLSADTKSPVASTLDPIKDWEKMATGKIKTLIGDSLIVKDDHTIAIVLSHPAAYFLQTFSSSASMVVNKNLIEKYGNKWTDHLQEGAGAGPFKVQSYSHDKGLILVPNPYYYGPKPKLEKLELLRSGSTDTAYRSYLAGQLDYAQVPSVNVPSVRKRPDYNHAVELHITYLNMNYLAKPFDTIKIRQAFALATNKDLIAENVMHGAMLPTNHLVPEGMPGYNKNLTGPAGVASTKGDPVKAKQLLQEGMQEAGYASIKQLPPITFTYFANDSDVSNLAAVLSQQWQSVLGITVKLNVISADVLIEQETNTAGNSGPLQFWFMGISNFADPQGWLSFNFGRGASFNVTNYGQNKSSDAATQQAVQDELQKADVNLNPQERMQQYNDAEQKLVNDVSWLPLYQSETHHLANPKLQLPGPDLELVAPDDWSKVYFAQ
ncbi:peptide ABC transporter substrate-binding protein [Ktedonosporobacter rubrisoli]|nr:peptide ABC transporter substrate-binding protein [Ktedonosporobacter rubrisoli]